jgi:hypothetical protein
MKLQLHTFQAMGSRCEFKLYLPNNLPSSSVFERLQQQVLRFEKKYSRYLNDSVATTINASAGSGKK